MTQFAQRLLINAMNKRLSPGREQNSELLRPVFHPLFKTLQAPRVVQKFLAGIRCFRKGAILAFVITA